MAELAEIENRATFVPDEVATGEVVTDRAAANDVAAPTKFPKTLAELAALPSFRALSEEQAALVAEYITNGQNKLEAVRKIYKPSTPQAERVASFAYFSVESVRECLDDIYEVSEEERLLRVLDRMIYSRRTTRAQVAALKLKMELQGMLSEPGVNARSAEA